MAEMNDAFWYVRDHVCPNCKWRKPKSKKDCPIYKNLLLKPDEHSEHMYGYFIVGNGHGGWRCRQFMAKPISAKKR